MTDRYEQGTRRPPRERLLARLNGDSIWLHGLAALVIAALVAISFSVLWQGRSEIIEQSERNVGNLELAVRQDVLHTFDLYKLSMQAAAEQSVRNNFQNLSASIGQDILFRRLGGMRVLDATGAVRFDSSGRAPTRNYADRGYFEFHRRDPSTDFYVSRPLRRGSDGAWLIVITQRISWPNGDFAGVVAASIEVAYFQTLFDKLMIGNHGTIFLVRSDGIMLAPTADSVAVIGDDIRKGMIFQHILRSPHEFYLAASPHYGSWKTYTHSKLPDLPIYLSVALDISDLYATWFRKLLATVGVVGVLVVAVGVLTLLWRKRERDLRLQFNRFRTALNKMPHGVSMFDADQKLIVCNDRYGDIYGLSEEHLRARAALPDLVRRRTKNIFASEQSAETYLADRRSSLAGKPGERRIYEYPDGRVIAVSHEPMEDGGWVSTHEDITERQRFEQQITHLANHDPLTGLPNRLHLHQRLETLLAHGGGDADLAVLYLDLDGFKSVNDTFGHAVGDRLLQEVADRLRNSVREGDIVGRLGGDEFAILVLARDPQLSSSVLARRIIQSFYSPFTIDGTVCSLAVSIGVALAPKDGADSDALFRCADLALYQAKNEGRGRYCFYAAELNVRLQERRALEADLRLAIQRHELQLHFQPIVALDDGRPVGFEALLRWTHPTKGLIPPTDFIPVAEESGLINEVGEWVLAKACETAVGWPSNIRVAVNISTMQFRNDDFAQQVQQVCERTGLDFRRLELEVTESVLVRDTPGVLATLKRLRAQGVRMALDDFGTGYSSLSYLRAFPFDKLKIDRGFVAELASSDDSRAIIRAIVALGRALALDVTAEGIETEEQLAILRGEGCREGQGYFFAKPMPEAAVGAFLEAQPHERDHAA